MREKLIELLNDCQAKGFWSYGTDCKTGEHGGHEMTEEDIADYLVENIASKWIPVTERLPEKEMEVIVYTGNILKPSVHCYHFWTADLLSWQSVTHWMPLPEPPKGE